jgi:hypothetical protein
VDIFVSEKADDECGDGEDDDAHSMTDTLVCDDPERLRACDRIHRGPTNAGDAVEQGDDLGSPPAPAIPCRCHLPETELGSKRGSGSGDHGGENVEEYNGGDRVAQTEFEQAGAEDPDS